MLYVVIHVIALIFVGCSFYQEEMKAVLNGAHFEYHGFTVIKPNTFPNFVGITLVRLFLTPLEKRHILNKSPHQKYNRSHLHRANPKAPFPLCHVALMQLLTHTIIHSLHMEQL